MSIVSCLLECVAWLVYTTKPIYCLPRWYSNFEYVFYGIVCRLRQEVGVRMLGLFECTKQTDVCLHTPRRLPTTARRDHASLAEMTRESSIQYHRPARQASVPA